MKVCVLSCFDDLLLKDTGYSVRIYNLARGLAERKHEVHVIIPSVDKDWSTIAEGVFVHGLHGLFPKGFLKILGRFFGISKYTSLFFYDFLFLLKSTQIVRRCDLLQVEQPSVAVFFALLAKLLGKPLVADCHDVFQALRVKHTGFLRRVLETSIERTVYNLADVVFVVSEKEHSLLSGIVGPECLEVVPNGVDCDFFSPLSVPDSGLRKRYGLADCAVVVFVGNLEYLPNQEAVNLIGHRIAPRVLNKFGNVKFLVAGRIPEGLHLPFSKGLIFAGRVSSVPEVLGISDVAIAPLIQGSGTRLKVLEYLSSGLPVVSTSIGVEGLHLLDGVHVLVEDNIHKFPDRIVELLDDQRTARKLRENARRIVLGKYDWRVIVKKVEDIHVRVARLAVNV